jgi:CDP-paratose synthetase
LKKKILITGINGFLGSHLAKHLKKYFEVVGLEYSIDNLYRIKNDGFMVYESNESTLETIFKTQNIYAVVHVATIYRRQGEPILNLLNTNINLPVRLLELASKYQVKMFLNTDSFFNSPSHTYSYLSDYTLSKKHSLEWIKLIASSSDCKVINMKVFHMFGENDAQEKFIPFVIEKIKNNEISIELTSGEQTRDFIYVKDVVTAFEKVLFNFDTLEKFQEFELGSGKSHTIKQLVKIIKKAANSKTVLKFGSLPYREGEIMESSVSNFELNKMGWKSNYTLEDAIKKIINRE